MGHPQIRARGTLGGSCAHADPDRRAAGRIHGARRPLPRALARGARTVAAADFFVTQLTTVLGADELLVEVEVPAAARRRAHAGSPSTRRTHGDWATRRRRRGASHRATRRSRCSGPGRRRSAPPRPRRRSPAGADAGEAARIAAQLVADAVARGADGLARRPRARGGRRVRIAVDVNGQRHEADVEPRTLLSRLPPPRPRADRHARRLRARRLRRLHGAGRRRARARLPDVRRAGRRPVGAHRRGARGRRRRAAPAAAGVPRAPRAAVRLLHARAS